jgi:hypothetical protein
MEETPVAQTLTSSDGHKPRDSVTRDGVPLFLDSALFMLRLLGKRMSPSAVRTAAKRTKAIGQHMMSTTAEVGPCLLNASTSSDQEHEAYSQIRVQ